MGGATEKDSRTSMLSVRLGQEEQDKVRSKAESRGESVSQFIREAVLEKCAPSVSVPFASYPTSVTATTSGFAMEAHDGVLVPKAIGAYVAHSFGVVEAAPQPFETQG
jgi:hexokinase